ncbi:MAG: DUF2203 domain-containing protein [Candidatus Thermoplasmatota archaeon]
MEGPMDLRIQPYVPARLFTVHEADALVPRLAEIFNRMDPKLVRLKELEDLLEDAESYWGSKGETMPPEEREGYERLIEERDETRALLDEDIQEISTLGCELKDLHSGLVDFPAPVDNTLAYLCWQRGERKIANWHPLEGGFAGRRPLRMGPQAER